MRSYGGWSEVSGGALSAQRPWGGDEGGLRTWRFCARTVDMLVMPKTKQMASRMLDLPEPLRPVMELKLSSLRRGCQRMHLAARDYSRLTILR